LIVTLYLDASQLSEILYDRIGQATTFHFEYEDGA
jgi:hypothetical protein